MLEIGVGLFPCQGQPMVETSCSNDTQFATMRYSMKKRRRIFFNEGGDGIRRPMLTKKKPERELTHPLMILSEGVPLSDNLGTSTAHRPNGKSDLGFSAAI